MHIQKIAIFTISALSLVACSQVDSYGDLQQYVEEVKSRPGDEVEPAPTFFAYEAFKYSAAGLRGPFDIPIAITLGVDGRELKHVEPNLERQREKLEDHAIAELYMVGMLERNRMVVALVEDAIGEVHRIKLGNYLGRNHGRVVSISDNQLDLIEIVPSGDGGWIERPQSLVMTR